MNRGTERSGRGRRTLRRFASHGVCWAGMALIGVLTVPAVVLLGLAALIRSGADRLSARLGREREV